MNTVLNPCGFIHVSEVGTAEEDSSVVDLLELMAGLEIDLTTAIDLDGDTLQDSIITNLAKKPLDNILPPLKGLIISNLRSLDEIDLVIVPKLTGFICPGLDYFINNARLEVTLYIYALFHPC